MERHATSGPRVVLPPLSPDASVSLRVATKADTCAAVEERYASADYDAGVQRLVDAVSIVQPSLWRLRALEESGWFRPATSYAIRVSLYGTPGSFDANSNTIVVRCDRFGETVRSAEQVVLHEIAHIGIAD